MEDRLRRVGCGLTGGSPETAMLREGLETTPRPPATQTLPPQGAWGSQQPHPTATHVFLSCPGPHACVLRRFSHDPVDCSARGSSVHGVLQASILEWVAIPFSRGSSPPRGRTWVSYISCIWQVGSLPLAPPRKPWSTVTNNRNGDALPWEVEVSSDISFPRC